MNVSLERSNFVTHEPIIATITVENRAGKDIVLGGPGKTSWLSVDLRSSEGKIISPDSGNPQADPVVLKNLATISRKVNLTAYYPVEYPEPINWPLASISPTFSVGFPGRGARYFRSTARSRRFGSAPSACRKATRRTGRYRRYKLFTSKSNAHTPSGNLELQLVYVQITDEETGLNLTTYPLGEILSYRDPQPTTDRDGNLHLLYMNAPQAFVHVVVDCDGAIKEQKLYHAGRESPELMQSGDGYITVRGGRLYDPIVEEQLAKARAEGRCRSLSDRPPGLPQLPAKRN